MPETIIISADKCHISCPLICLTQPHDLDKDIDYLNLSLWLATLFATLYQHAKYTAVAKACSPPHPLPSIVKMTGQVGHEPSWCLSLEIPCCNNAAICCRLHFVCQVCWSFFHGHSECSICSHQLFHLMSFLPFCKCSYFVSTFDIRSVKTWNSIHEAFTHIRTYTSVL